MNSVFANDNVLPFLQQISTEPCLHMMEWRTVVRLRNCHTAVLDQSPQTVHRDYRKWIDLFSFCIRSSLRRLLVPALFLLVG